MHKAQNPLQERNALLWMPAAPGRPALMTYATLWSKTVCYQVLPQTIALSSQVIRLPHKFLSCHTRLLRVVCVRPEYVLFTSAVCRDHPPRALSHLIA